MVLLMWLIPLSVAVFVSTPVGKLLNSCYGNKRDTSLAKAV